MKLILPGGPTFELTVAELLELRRARTEEVAALLAAPSAPAPVPTPSPPPPKFHCTTCDRTFSTAARLHQHEIWKHRPGRKPGKARRA